MKDMMGREEVLSVSEARKRILAHFLQAVPRELETDIDSSVGRILSRDIVSPEDLPSFSRSTMDGFAVNSSDSFAAKDGMPAYLTITGEVFMGERPDFSIKKGEAAKIPTGGMLPEGSDSVVMFEHTSNINETIIEIIKPAAPGENTIQKGEDCGKDQTILKAGRRLRPQDIGALAGLGIVSVWVYDKPRVAVIATGDEIVPASSSLKTGQVRDINSHSLTGLIESNGGKVIRKGILKDTYDIMIKTVNKCILNEDMIIITGGSSVGTKDLTAKIINDAGGPGVLFPGVSVKPGKPTIAGIVNNKPIFGLPGHPAAIMVCFDLFVKPVLKLLTGEKDKLSEDIKRTVKARLTKNISSSAGREDHVRVALEKKDDELWANPVLGKSGLITTLVKADGTIIIHAGKPGLEQGTEVDVELF